MKRADVESSRSRAWSGQGWQSPYVCYGSSLSRGPAREQHRTTRTSEVTDPA